MRRCRVLTAVIYGRGGARVATTRGCGGVTMAPMRERVHPRWGVTSNHQEHEQGAEWTGLAAQPPARAGALPLPLPHQHLVGLPVRPGRATGRPHRAGRRARLAARRRRRPAPVPRRLPPRPLRPDGTRHRLPVRDHRPGAPDALSGGRPARRWWVVDTTASDQPSARQVCGSRQCRRGHRRSSRGVAPRCMTGPQLAGRVGACDGDRVAAWLPESIAPAVPSAGLAPPSRAASRRRRWAMTMRWTSLGPS